MLPAACSFLTSFFPVSHSVWLRVKTNTLITVNIWKAVWPPCFTTMGNSKESTTTAWLTCVCSCLPKDEKRKEDEEETGSVGPLDETASEHDTKEEGYCPELQDGKAPNRKWNPCIWCMHRLLGYADNPWFMVRHYKCSWKIKQQYFGNWYLRLAQQPKLISKTVSGGGPFCFPANKQPQHWQWVNTGELLTMEELKHLVIVIMSSKFYFSLFVHTICINCSFQKMFKWKLSKCSCT